MKGVSIYEILESQNARGEEKRIRTEKLLPLSGFNDVRELREQVARERVAGSLICSTKGNGGGYYIPETDEELQNYCRMMRSSAIGHFSAMKAARAELKQRGKLPEGM